jgi:hypothetical protein
MASSPVLAVSPIPLPSPSAYKRTRPSPVFATQLQPPPLPSSSSHSSKRRRAPFTAPVSSPLPLWRSSVQLSCAKSSATLPRSRHATSPTQLWPENSPAASPPRAPATVPRTGRHRPPSRRNSPRPCDPIYHSCSATVSPSQNRTGAENRRGARRRPAPVVAPSPPLRCRQRRQPPSLSLAGGPALRRRSPLSLPRSWAS